MLGEDWFRDTEAAKSTSYHICEGSRRESDWGQENKEKKWATDLGLPFLHAEEVADFLALGCSGGSVCGKNALEIGELLRSDAGTLALDGGGGAGGGRGGMGGRCRGRRRDMGGRRGR